MIPTCPCGICGQPTTMTATKRCDRCWELEHRIEGNPDLARKILAKVEHERAPRVLTTDAQADRDNFDNEYGFTGNCSCHLSPPCGSCTHPGNPDNQKDDPECWMLAADVEPDALDNVHAENELDMLDASVFSGDAFISAAGVARMNWYLRRWQRRMDENEKSLKEEAEASNG
jgi:hypothetical protein